MNLNDIVSAVKGATHPLGVVSSCIRSAIVAPKGRKLVVADLANIEGRMLAWLAKEESELDAFRAFDAGKGPDIYKLTFSKSFNVPVDQVTDAQRFIGKIQCLALGYQGSIGAYSQMCEAYGSEPPPEDEILTIVRGWRSAHPNTVAWWYALNDASIEAVENPECLIPAGRVTFMYTNGFLLCKLPSGRYLTYYQPEIEEDPERGKKMMSYMGVHQYTRKWTRLRTYGGKFAENCIAVGTPVLTHRGWVEIQNILTSDKIWDGVEWVKHDGSLYKGVQPTISAHGVRMTPDHLVYTTRGWKHASQSQRHNRFDCRLPDSYPVCGERRKEIPLGSALYVRANCETTSDRTRKAEKARDSSIMRVQARRNNRAKTNHSWDVSAPSVPCMAGHVSTLLSSVSSSLAALRRTRDRGMRQVAQFLHCLLERHERGLYVGAYAGPHRQFEGVFATELSMGDVQNPSEQHPANSSFKHALRENDGDRGLRTNRNQPRHFDVSPTPRVSCQPDTRTPGFSEQVFDLINCGPRQRFVVRSSDGRPLIVHNCTQACARDVLAEGMRLAELAGYDVVLSVHDELVTEVPDDPSYGVGELITCMTKNPDWCVDLPLAAEGYESKRYRK